MVVIVLAIGKLFDNTKGNSHRLDYYMCTIYVHYGLLKWGKHGNTDSLNTHFNLASLETKVKFWKNDVAKESQEQDQLENSKFEKVESYILFISCYGLWF